MKKVVFLDRDGTINVDHGYVHDKAQWEFTPHAPQALKTLADHGYALAVVTNQSGIGNKLYTAEEVEILHAHMRTLLKEKGVNIDVIAYCPHIPSDQCDCRKPLPGMFQQIEHILGPIDYSKSWMVGDKLADILFGQAKGVRTVLLKSSYWHSDELGALNTPPTFIAEDLRAAAEYIVGVV